MIKKAALFGLAIATIYVLWLVAIVIFEISKIQVPLLPLVINTLIIAVPLFAGLMYIRKTAYDNSINFAQSFYTGIAISVCAAIAVYIILALLETAGLLIPNLIADYKNSTQAYLNDPKLTRQELKDIQESYKNITEPYLFSKLNFVQVLLISAFSSTILSLFVRNKDTFTEIK